MPPELGFYDHHRMSYGNQPIHSEGAVAKFMVGEFMEDAGTLGPGGEFAICLYALDGPTRWRGGKPIHPKLTPRILAFDDGFRALQHFISLGGLERLANTQILSGDGLSWVLFGLGLRDYSDRVLTKQELTT